MQGYHSKLSGVDAGSCVGCASDEAAAGLAVASTQQLARAEVGVGCVFRIFDVCSFDWLN